MNPLTNVKNLQKLNERELELGIIGKKSWHDEYKGSAWIFIGGLPHDLTEGDVICVFSQYGEIVNLNLIRDHKTGKIKGYGFLCYEDQRSTVLAVDNLNGIKILSRTIRVDHVKDYKVPKEFGDEDALTLKIRNDGCAPQLGSSSEADTKAETSDEDNVRKAMKKEKKSKKQKKKKKKKKKKKIDISSSSSLSESDDNDTKESPHSAEVKQERIDEGYNKALKKENTYRSDSSHSRHGSRDKTYRNGKDKHKYGGSNDSSRDRNDSSGERNGSSRDRNDSSRDRNDSTRDWNERRTDKNDISRDRTDSRDRRTDMNIINRDRNDSGGDRNDRRTDMNTINRDRNDSGRDRDSSYSRDRYADNGFQGQDGFSNRLDFRRGRGRGYENRGARGRYSDRGGERYRDQDRGRGWGRGPHSGRGNFRGQNKGYDGNRDRSRESRYY